MRKLLLITCLTVSMGCYQGFDSVDDSDVVITVEDDDTDYETIQTYVISDVVYDLDDLQRAPDGTRLTDFDAVILDTIDENMADLGYQLETDPENNPPDVAVLVGGVVSTNWTWVWLPGWDPWWPDYPPSYYPPVGIPASYKVGTLVMVMAQIGDRQQDDPVEISWVGLLDGVVSSRQSTNERRVVDSINQAFRQSPYLDRSQR